MLTSGRTGMFQGLWAYILVSEESGCAQLAALGMLHFTTPGPGVLLSRQAGACQGLII